MKKIPFLLTLLIITLACTSEEVSIEDNSSDQFNRTALLTNWSDNIIVPSFENYKNKLETLEEATTEFIDVPSVINLSALRTAWKEGYIALQYVLLYDIGKAEELHLIEKANTFPTNTQGIDENVTTQNYNLALISQFSKQGFPAIDYLINGISVSDTEILNHYSTANSQHATYLTALVTDLKNNINLVLNDWNSGYRATFISKTENNISGSVNQITNLFVKNLEKNIRTAKIGIPAGVFSNGTKFPEKVEAKYKGDISKTLLEHAIKSQKDFFNGTPFNGTTTGSSLASYLDYVNAVRDNQNLSAIINNQFGSITTKSALLSNNLYEQVNSNNSAMLAAYDALQQNVVYLKLDMMQALNITVDYVDSDGD